MTPNSAEMLSGSFLTRSSAGAQHPKGEMYVGYVLLAVCHPSARKAQYDIFLCHLAQCNQLFPNSRRKVKFKLCSDTYDMWCGKFPFVAAQAVVYRRKANVKQQLRTGDDEHAAALATPSLRELLVHVLCIGDFTVFEHALCLHCVHQTTNEVATACSKLSPA